MFLVFFINCNSNWSFLNMGFLYIKNCNSNWSILNTVSSLFKSLLISLSIYNSAGISYLGKKIINYFIIQGMQGIGSHFHSSYQISVPKYYSKNITTVRSTISSMTGVSGKVLGTFLYLVLYIHYIIIIHHHTVKKLSLPPIIQEQCGSQKWNSSPKS